MNTTAKYLPKVVLNHLKFVRHFVPQSKQKTVVNVADCAAARSSSLLLRECFIFCSFHAEYYSH